MAITKAVAHAQNGLEWLLHSTCFPSWHVVVFVGRVLMQGLLQ
jgi:hypothetical protein